MKVICIKTFTFEGTTFIKDLSYFLIQYDDQYIFYVGIIPDNKGPVAAYLLSKKYRPFFITLKEQRQQKLEKINNDSKMY